MSSVLYCESSLINKIVQTPTKTENNANVSGAGSTPEKDRNLFYSFTVRSTFISIETIE